MPLSPPAVDRIVLRQSPLRLVVAQMRFPTILSMPSSEYIAPFQEQIRNEYPALQQLQQTEIQVGPSAPSVSTPSTIWKFLDQDEVWNVSLAPGFLALESSAYTTYDDFASRFDRLLRALVDHFNPRRQIRLGLRYINEMATPERTDPREWRDLLNEDLMAVVTNDAFGEGIQSAVHLMKVNQGDGTFVMRFGFNVEQDTCTAVLDFDYYDEEGKDLEVDQAMASLNRYKDVIYRMFRWSIEQPLLDEFEPVS